jgi:hypothetical protein
MNTHDPIEIFQIRDIPVAYNAAQGFLPQDGNLPCALWRSYNNEFRP